MTVCAKDLTVLLTLKDRVAFTRRWMAYANAIRFPFPIVIADGGADETVPGLLSKKANYPNLAFEYIRFPYDQTFIQYYDKLLDTLSRIETTFVVLGDNDDFFDVSGVTRSLEFLAAHPGYSACRGRVGTVFVQGSDKYGDLRGLYGDQVTFHPQLYYNHSLEQESARERFEFHFANYSPTWYEVHRTAQLQDAFRVLRALEISDLYLAELLISGFTVIAGKVRREPGPYLVRQINTPGSSTTWGRDGFERMLQETWSADFKKFVQAMATALGDDAQDFVRQVYRSYIGSSLVGRARGADRKVTWQERIGGRIRQARLRFVAPAGQEEFKPIKNFLTAGK